MSTPYEQFTESDTALEAAAAWAAANPDAVLGVFLASDAGEAAYDQWCVDQYQDHLIAAYERDRDEALV